MGGRLSLTSKEHNYVSAERVNDILDNLTHHYKRHYCFHLLKHLRRKNTESSEPRPLIQRADVLPHGGIITEGTLPQCMDGIWTYCHLQVCSNFAVESRNSREVFEGGWSCKTELVLSGSHICTSVPEHCALVCEMCQHVTGKSDERLACWDCPTEFPVFIQHPYGNPVCLATGSREEQTRWANVLRAAVRHQSSALCREDSPESRAFLDAVLSMKKLRGRFQAEAYPIGCEEEVLAGMVMEEMRSYLKETVFPRICTYRSRRRKTWIKLLSEVYKAARCHVNAAMADLKEELSLYHLSMKKRISAGLHQVGPLQDHLANAITEDTYEQMLRCLQLAIIPRLPRTLQEVAAPVCDGFASIWEYFMETCDDVIDVASANTPEKDVKKELLTLLDSLGPDKSRMWECLDRLELSLEAREWLQDTWRVRGEIWRPLLLRAQDALYKVVNMCAQMFWRQVLRYQCFSSEPAHLTAALCRVRDKVVKNLESELLVLRSESILEATLRITLPAFEQGVNKQDLSRYDAMVSSEESLVIQPDLIFNSTLREILSSYIQSEMKYSLPQTFIPLPVCGSSPRSSISDLSEPVYHEELAHGVCQHTPGYMSEGSSLDSETLCPSSVSDREDTLDNSEKHVLASWSGIGPML
ncbi:protein Niban 1 isoform X1 [Fundulus heteroclitus]|uniref:protein Niban 1 isoform X1 n=1 Tax=Fundulus heteroclitus TaxID=8078 RepID=UPI00165C85EE|nr:protein Niban 1 isoform X1 [Fundulus heteroclitus]